MLISKESSKPALYPNMYLTARIRNKGYSVNTMEAVARTLALLHTFFDLKGIDISDRIISKKLLTIYEIDALVSYLGINNYSKKVINIKDKKLVSNQTKINRVSTVTHYLEWLCGFLLKENNEYRHVVMRFIGSIRERKPRSAVDFDFYSREPKALSDLQKNKLFICVKPNGTINPFIRSVQNRNELIILMLYCLGIRAGELLNLRISDIDFDGKIIKITKRHDDKFDNRVHQPLVKTLNRDLYFSPWLENKIYHYITGERQEYIGKNKHDYLFVTHGFNKGGGLPLSISAYEKIILKIRGSDDELKNFTGHRLRHTWNYDFSQEIKKMGKIDSNFDMEQVRSYLMGWSPSSGMVKTYNKKFNKEQSELMMQKIQSNIKLCLKGGTE